MAANPGSLFTATRSHAETERDLQAAGVRFTSLRNGFYATSAIWLLGPALRTGEPILPEDGPVSWTAHADLAEAAAIALTDEGRLDGITPPLTGPQALDFAGLAAVASQHPGLLPAWYAFLDARATRRAVQWLADNSLIDDEAADRFLTGHPDPDLP
jgi:uncharacterized protein YbjT (DUF2867 family)